MSIITLICNIDVPLLHVWLFVYGPIYGVSYLNA